MIKKSYIRFVIAAAFAAASTASELAFAVDEVEPNAPLASAQAVDVGSGSAEIKGAIGITTLGTAVDDLDFYSFEGKEGDVVTIDIDGGWKPAGSMERNVDTIVALFKPDLSVLIKGDQIPNTQPIDEGSVSRNDAYVKVTLPVSGTYYVGVAGWSSNRDFTSGGRLTSSSPTVYNGSYKLIISGVTPSAPAPIGMNIDIRPGATDLAVYNPKAKGNLPVALLSSAEFDPMKLDRGSIRFGANGDEQSLLRCNPQGTDLNKDGRPDLICHFDNEKLHFTVDHSYGTMTGKTDAGREFEGRGDLKIVPMRK